MCCNVSNTVSLYSQTSRILEKYMWAAWHSYTTGFSHTHSVNGCTLSTQFIDYLLQKCKNPASCTELKGVYPLPTLKVLCSQRLYSVLDYGDILYCHAVPSTVKLSVSLCTTLQTVFSCLTFMKLCCGSYQTILYLFPHLNLIT